MSGPSLSAKYILAAVFTFSVSCPIVAEPNIDSFGLRAEAVYWFGRQHSDQDRWVASFALANSAQLIRHANPVSNRHRTYNGDWDYELAAAVFQDRSPFAVQFNLTAHGDHTTMLWGVPVAAKISPMRSANGQGASWVANPWVWVGAVAVGGALAGGGGSGSGGGDSSSNNGGTTVAGGEECDVVSVSDSGPSIVSGCEAAGTEINAP